MSDYPVVDNGVNKLQVRLVLAAWGGITLLVIACILLASRFSQVRGALANEEPQPTVVQSPVVGVVEPVEAQAFGYGVQVRAERGKAETSIRLASEMDLNWVKQQVGWASMQPTPDEIHWEWLDALMARADDSDLNVMLSIVGAPEWARSSTSSGRTGPPDDYQEYVNFVLQILYRYPHSIDAIEVWNEQNLQREWYSVGGLSAARYVEMLSLTYESVKSIDPDIIVVSGALSATGVNDGIVAIDDFEYMDQMIAAGLLANADCIGAQHTGVNLAPDMTAEEAFEEGPPPGTVFLGPYDPENPLNPHHSWSFRSTLLGQYEKIAAAGGTQKLCVTEFGWASSEGFDGDEIPEEFDFAWDNTQADQAAYVVQAYQLLREWDIAQMAFLWNLDFVNDPEQPLNGNALYSIVMPDGSPRPAFHAISAMPKD